MERTQIMAELLAVALRCNLTRVFTFMLTSPATTHVFSDLGVPDGMHKTCHDGHWERVRAITESQMGRLCALAGRAGSHRGPDRRDVDGPRVHPRSQ